MKQFNIFSLITLMLLITLSTCGSLILTANLPMIGTLFNKSESSVNLLMVCYLLGIMISQILTTHYLHHIPWLKTLRHGFCLVLLSLCLNTVAVHTHLFSLLCLGRFINGLGTGAAYLLALLLITTAFSYEASRKALAITNLAFSCVPYFAIVAGGWIGENWGILATLIIFSVYILFVVILTHLSPLRHITPNIPHDFLKQAKTLYKDRHIQLGAILTGCLSSSMYLYFTLCPHVAFHFLTVTGSEYGRWLLVSAVTATAGNLTAAYTHRYDARLIMNRSGLLGWVAIIGLIVAVYLHYFNPWTLFVIPSILAFSGQLYWGNILPYFTQHTENKLHACMLLSLFGAMFTVITLVLTSTNLFTPLGWLMGGLCVVWTILTLGIYFKPRLCHA